MSRPFAIVTGASSGIRLELASICAQEGFDLLVAGDRSEIRTVADRFRGFGADVTPIENIERWPNQALHRRSTTDGGTCDGAIGSGECSDEIH